MIKQRTLSHTSLAERGGPDHPRVPSRQPHRRRLPHRHRRTPQPRHPPTADDHAGADHRRRQRRDPRAPGLGTRRRARPVCGRDRHASDRPELKQRRASPRASARARRRRRGRQTVSVISTDGERDPLQGWEVITITVPVGGHGLEPDVREQQELVALVIGALAACGIRSSRVKGRTSCGSMPA